MAEGRKHVASTLAVRHQVMPSHARACTAAQTPANILIVDTRDVQEMGGGSRSAFGKRRGEELNLLRTSGAMLACLGVRACVFAAAWARALSAAPSAMVFRHHRHPHRPPTQPTAPGQFRN